MNNQRPMICIWKYFLFIIFLFNSISSQEIYKSRIIYENIGTQFSPSNPSAQLLSTISTLSLKMCVIECNTNILCRIFDYGVNYSGQCRLFEGDITMGNIISSPSSNSTVGIVQISSDLFIGYGLSCSSFCSKNRYLTCSNNSTCQCILHTYWNGLICAAQTPILGASCQQNISMCRTDLNYTCLRFNQCGPLSILSGTTIADLNTTIVGSTTPGLNLPLGIIVDAPIPGSILVADSSKGQVVRLSDDISYSINNSVVARNWTGGNQFASPNDIFFDRIRGNNLYVSDTNHHRVVMFVGMQSISPQPTIIAGTGIAGPGSNQLNAPRAIVIDQRGNIIIADFSNHRIMLYLPNSTNGTMIIGTGTAGNNSLSLNSPVSLFLDEHNSWLYVADAFNYRIQRFSLNDSLPLNGVTVAGGNGNGIRSDQLGQPFGVWVSNKTGAIYIADRYNHRIQRWSRGATSGVTIAGDPYGNLGSNATMLNNPCRLSGNINETFLYVSDSTNHRIQRFQLI